MNILSARSLYSLCMMWVLLVVASWAVSWVAIPNWAYIVDEAEIFWTQDEVTITESLQTIEEKWWVQWVVVSTDSLEWWSIQEQATNLWNFLDSERGLEDNIFERDATQWVWDAESNLWFVFLIAPNEREWFVSVWLGMEKYITDAEIGAAWRSLLPDSFSREAYWEWVVSMLEWIDTELAWWWAQLPAQPEWIGTWTIPSDLIFFLFIASLVVWPTIWAWLKTHGSRAKAAWAGGWVIGLISAISAGWWGAFIWILFMIVFYIALHMKPGAWWTWPGRWRWGFGWMGWFGGGRSFGWWSFMGWWWGWKR